MQKLPAQAAASMQAFLQDAGPRLAQLCTACGACFEACPMVDVVGLRTSDPRAVTDDDRPWVCRELRSLNRLDGEVEPVGIAVGDAARLGRTTGLFGTIHAFSISQRLLARAGAVPLRHEIVSVKPRQAVDSMSNRSTRSETA